MTYSGIPILNIPANNLDYGNNYKKRGTCLLINNKTFRSSYRSERNGSEEDVVQLTECFKDLAFNVKPLIDKKSSEIMSELKSASEDPSNFESDCFLCVVMTHGDQENLCAFDRTYEITKLFHHFTGELCSSLRGKPKIFFIQACRGEQIDTGVPVGHMDSSTLNYYKIPITSDFLIVYSSYAGYASYRHPVQGSWFINSLTAIFNQYSKEMDLMSMLGVVNRMVAYEFESKNAKNKQMTCIVSTLTRKLFFTPKNCNDEDDD